jgi:hypothetical protein
MITLFIGHVDLLSKVDFCHGFLRPKARTLVFVAARLSAFLVELDANGDFELLIKAR